jgi:adenine deaminase
MPEEKLQVVSGKAANMTFSLMSLPLIPELRLTDHGLIDTLTFQRVSLLL